MARINLAFARTVSRRIFEARKKTHIYQQKQTQYELHITVTSNNIFVNFCNGVGNTIFLKTFGLIGYFGVKRKTRYALYFYGLEVGEAISGYFNDLKNRKELNTIPKFPIILHSVVSDGDLRYHRFFEGVKKHNIKFSELVFKRAIPYNGCRLKASRRIR